LRIGLTSLVSSTQQTSIPVPVPVPVVQVPVQVRVPNLQVPVPVPSTTRLGLTKHKVGYQCFCAPLPAHKTAFIERLAMMSSRPLLLTSLRRETL